MRCNRCQFHTSPDDDTPAAEQMAEHALATSHHLCPVCGNSLSDTDPALSCERCLTKVRENIATLVTLYDELPEHLGHVRSQVYDSDRPSAADGRPLPGGDVLALLGPGSEGLSEDCETSREGDPTSIAFELDWWERDLRETRNDVLDTRPRSTRAVVRSAAGYLEVHARWAANSHPGFPHLASDLHRMVQSLLRATGRHERPIPAEADCFDCGGPLLREIHPRLSDPRPHREGTKYEGYADDFTCQRCKRRYEWHSYVLALRAKLEQDLGGWIPVEEAADRTGVLPDTIRKWIRRGRISSTCTAIPGVKDKHIRVHPDEVAEYASRRTAS